MLNKFSAKNIFEKHAIELNEYNSDVIGSEVEIDDEDTPMLIDDLSTESVNYVLVKLLIMLIA